MPKEPTRAAIDEAVERAEACARDDDHAGAWTATEPLCKAQSRQRDVALALLHLVGRRAFAIEQRLEIVRAVYEEHAADDEVLGKLGSKLEDAIDRRFLNAAPPSDPLAGSM